jgi:hypothetical protein
MEYNKVLKKVGLESNEFRDEFKKYLSDISSDGEVPYVDVDILPSGTTIVVKTDGIEVGGKIEQSHLKDFMEVLIKRRRDLVLDNFLK